ncbi:MAG: hypothetical protein AAF611_21115 [Bacteroidota bacterium]
MKFSKRNLGTLNLLKSRIAKVGDIHSLHGGSIPKETENCPSQNTCTYNCGGDTIDTQG